MTDETNDKKSGSGVGKAAIGAAAIGSAAIAAALLYASKRKKKDADTPTPPSGENPETD
ncbi:MAG: hypothetical protein ABJ242_06110 [Marinomonas sp.]|uniref:isopropylmalate isomerase n=1 Tax=Parasphingorhabdus sp. TaxID=2709688 RepID=UPI0032699310